MPPSKRHDELTERAVRWLGNRATLSGIRGALEVAVAEKYVCDALVSLAFQNRYAVELARRAGHPCQRKNKYGDMSSWAHGRLVTVVETKVSRADFLATFGANTVSEHATCRKHPVADLHFVVADKGVCKAEELPDFWGLLEPRGVGLSVKRQAYFTRSSQATRDAHQATLLWKPGRFHRVHEMTMKQGEGEG